MTFSGDHDTVSEGEKDMLPSDKYRMPRAKIERFLLKPGAKHAQEFFDVGYTTRDVETLNSDIHALFDESKAVEFRRRDDGALEFNIYMFLGVQKKKRFRTVWRRDEANAAPRFITAYRKDE